jgi:tRNA(Ile)-lysidine synthase
MLNRFIRHVRENKILDFQSYYILAISGGIDSVVLAHLLSKGGFKFGMAHCNFQLRGEESERDEAFIINLAKDLGVEIWCKKFNTKAYMESHGVSLQMAARNLRYKWFGELHEAKHPEGILVAHHADDQLETILLNLLRGTGIEGLYGMARTKGYIIRPLLAFKRVDLEHFLKAENLLWREDSSNNSVDYKRNFVRHRIVPEIDAFDPKGGDLMRYSFERVKDTGKAFFYFFENWKQQNIQVEEGYEYLALKSLEGVPGEKSLLYYWLKEKGFGFLQVKDIVSARKRGEVGKRFISGEWMVNLDRENIILGPFENDGEQKMVGIHDIDVVVNGDYYDLLTLGPQTPIDRSPENAMVNQSLLDFPLTLRNWEQGDKFKPLGMSKFKKVSDFLIDLKVPLIKKRNVKVLCSGDQIVWLVGLRIDDRFKVGGSTPSILYIKKKRNV